MFLISMASSLGAIVSTLGFFVNALHQSLLSSSNTKLPILSIGTRLQLNHQ
ncbi:Hypothetical protein FNO222_1298 [Francisella orientalis]|uniref:Uncharacterized protein n=1 Tax=Francisella orientalis TaxID=299583 RepID=A0ABN4GZV8_9GAMM|nr:hypothetical protein FNO12_1285 [Francisella orientalis FNO12]AKN87406.1 Hypothetical protein FNO24_1287 [Francisella orientalis FNO24]AKN88943.1 Hypothetical protein FNO190_1285 [Francisella orientalis]AKU05703.1 Hypothetical protein FNO01_1285 [Francisella orientalis]QEN20618.1 Hypothetical protein FNO39_1298 [Francisella orientalis]